MPISDNYKRSLSRSFRRNETDAEHMLWMSLRNRQLMGFKFRRQQQLGDYVVDLIYFESKIIIEVDGGQHNQKPNIQTDEKRTQWLETQGYRVLRFWNNDILTNLEGVVQRISETLSGEGI
jgi:very-short-patch-repair endonuclease